ncbi:MAG TPA: hypothetical protein VGF76_24070, partial [Polyangiaceae bacterium]
MSEGGVVANLHSVPNRVSPEGLAKLSKAFPPSARIRTAFPVMASASPEIPHWVQLLLDATTWKAFIG